MAFFDKLKSGLSKTKNAIMGQIDDLFKSFVKVDEDLLDELEELLICADVGVGATEEIIEELRERIKDGRLKEKDETLDTLKEMLKEMIGKGGPLDLSGTPSVILVIGVNGVGKTTSIAKIANKLKSEGKDIVLAAAEHSAQRRSTSLRYGRAVSVSTLSSRARAPTLRRLCLML